MAEWSIAAVLKTVDPSRGPWVRILPPPPEIFLLNFIMFKFIFTFFLMMVLGLNMVWADLSPEAEFSKYIQTLDQNKVYSISQATAKYQTLFGPVKDQTIKLKAYREWQKYYEAVRRVQNQVIASKNDQLLSEGSKPSLATKAFWSALKYNGLSPDLEEGVYSVEPDYDYLVRNFSKFLPGWLSEFNKLIAQELKEGFVMDQMSNISADKLSKKIVLWQNYLKKYPDTENQVLIQEKIKIYNKVLKENLKNGKK